MAGAAGRSGCQERLAGAARSGCRSGCRSWRAAQELAGAAGRSGWQERLPGAAARSSCPERWWKACHRIGGEFRHTRSLGIQEVPHPLAEQVGADHRQQDRHSGEGGDPPVPEDELPTLAEHGPPLGGRRLGSQAEEAEGGRDQEGVPETERGEHDDRRQDIGHHVATDDPEVRSARRPAGLDERPRLHVEHCAVHDPHVGRHRRDPHRDDEVLEARPRRRHDGEGEQDPGEREQEIREPEHDRAGPALVVARHQPEERAGHAADDDRQESHPERLAPSPDHAAQDVTAEDIGPQRVGRPRRSQGRALVLGDGVIRSQPGRDAGHRDQRQQQHAAGHRAPVPQEAPELGIGRGPGSGRRSAPPTEHRSESSGSPERTRGRRAGSPGCRSRR